MSLAYSGEGDLKAFLLLLNLWVFGEASSQPKSINVPQLK